MSVLDDVRALLVRSGVAFRESSHAPTPTSADSARVRGDPLSQGAKALVLKYGERFAVFVMSAARRLDSGAVKRRLKVKKVRFATPEELAALTGLVPGSVPPFGRPVFDLDLFVDVSVSDQQKVSFNAGSLTDSNAMSAADYMAAADADVFCFSK